MSSVFSARLTWRAAGLRTLTCGLLLLALASLLDGGRSKYIHIRWRPGLSDVQRIDQEWEFGLRARVREGRSFGYDLTDLSSSNVEDIVTDRAVEDTADLDLTQFEVLATAGDGRAGSGLACVVGAAPWFSAVGMAGWPDGTCHVVRGQGTSAGKRRRAGRPARGAAGSGVGVAELAPDRSSRKIAVCPARHCLMNT